MFSASVVRINQKAGLVEGESTGPYTSLTATLWPCEGRAWCFRPGSSGTLIGSYKDKVDGQLGTL